MARKTSVYNGGDVIVSTIGYLGQHFWSQIVEDANYDTDDKRQKRFIEIIKEFDFSKDELKEFLQMAQQQVDDRRSQMNSAKPKFYIPDNYRSKLKIINTMFLFFDDFQKNIRLSTSCYREDMDSSIHELYEDDQGDHSFFVPHPCDSKLILESFTAQRKLQILEKTIANLATIQDQEPQEPSSFASMIRNPSSTPKPKSVPKRMVKQAIKVSAEKGTDLQRIKEISTKNIEHFECSFDELQKTVTANFRIVCSKTPVNIELSKMQFWKENGLEVRPWSGLIQDLTKRTKIRRLVSGLNAYDINSNKNHITDKFCKMYDNSHKITVQEFNFKKQTHKMKNFVIEIESINNNNVNDLITDYCESRNIKIRPWRGKLPGGTSSTLSTFD
jgi:hypothetical protein